MGQGNSYHSGGGSRAPSRIPCLSEASPLLENRPADPAAAEEKVPLELFFYQCATFWATVKPVALTMILTCISVIKVTTADQREAARSSSQAYTVYANDDDVDGEDGGGEVSAERIGQSVINAIVIVAVLCAVTFLVVCLYKYNCLKVLWGYMMFSCFLLFSQLGGVYFATAIERWDLILDVPMFFFTLYNFGVVGVISIFMQRGTPLYVTQLYLVALATIFAWNLAQFEDWTAWCLLIALALYDLCAVLTPCGPLKALVNLMEERGQPMPGLLYEAQVGGPPAEFTRPDTPGEQEDARPRTLEDAGAAAVAAATVTAPPAPPPPPPRAAAEGARGGGALKLAAGSGGLREGGEGGEGGVVVSPLAGEEQRRQEINLGPLPMGGEGEEAMDDPDESDGSVKLGIGDFVFYSVLVGKAAMSGFATLAACFLVILAGLGGTLLLLSVYKKALPALPISIFLGCIFFFCTRVFIVPYMEAILAQPLYS